MTEQNSLVLADADQRARIETETDRSLFVEAGAGSGKTYALVRRIHAMVLRDGVDLARVAAITFTDKAAAELRERVRAHLAAHTPADEIEAVRREAALAAIDTAAIGTLHAFAARLITENPIAAGVPPQIEVVDQMGAELAFEHRWRRMRARLFPDPARAAADPSADAGEIQAVADAVSVLLASGASVNQIRTLAKGLDGHWNRLDGHAPIPALTAPDYSAALPAGRELCLLAEQCADPDDKLYAKFVLLSAWLDEFAAAVDAGDLDAQTGLIDSFPKPGAGGTKKNWAATGIEPKELRDRFKDIGALFAAAQTGYRARATEIVLARLSRDLVAEAEARRRSGALEYHDLLILARRVVGDPEAAARIRENYRYLLLDEFQDTDPLQMEIATAIAGDRPGALFIVGDPKQSIYRFRRADIATYMDARSARDQADMVHLQTNFRSTRGVLDFANEVFARLITAEDRIQAEYVPLLPAPGRPAPEPAEEAGAQPMPAPMIFAGQPTPEQELAWEELKDSERTRALEASDTARIIGAALTAGWCAETGRDGQCSRTPITAADVCVLIPSRTVLPYIEDALEAAGIEFRAEASSLVYSTPEILDLLTAARALAYRADTAALIAALRSPLFACGDDDLLDWQAGIEAHRAAAAAADAGSGVPPATWSLAAPPPADLELALRTSPVGKALGWLAGLRRETADLEPARVLERLAEERGTFVYAMDTVRGRDIWRRLRFVIDQARAWHESSGGDLRGYLAWAQTQADENARVTEAVVPEIGIEAVRIMTMHASKGLQFPMVVVAGMSGGFVTQPDPVLWAGRRPEVAVSKNARSAGYAEAAEHEKAHQRAERIRLLYVACTRAESLLAVSGHQPSRDGWGKLLAPGIDELAVIDPATLTAPDLPGVAAAPAAGAQTWDQWQDQKRTIAERSAEPSLLSATRIVAGDDPAVDAVRAAVTVPGPAGHEQVRAAIDATESGTGFGDALHLVLADLDPAAEIDEDRIRAAAQAAEITDTDRFVALVRAAHAAEPVRQAAVAPQHWRELPMTGTVGGRPVEGIADLVYRSGDGTLTVVDYKTDIGVSAATLEDYWTQLAVYARLLEDVGRQQVGELVLVFLRSDRAQVLRRRVGAAPA